MLRLPFYFKTYRELTEVLGIPFYTSSTNRRTQEKYLSKFFVFTREKRGYHMTEQIKPYTPPPKSSRITVSQTKKEIETQLLHALADKKAHGCFTSSARGLASEITLTFSSAFELVGLAIPSWRDLKIGELNIDVSSHQQRQAYFDHHNVCYSKWKATVKALEEKGLIIRKPWYSVVEVLDFLEKKPVRTRLINETELGDCLAIDKESLAILNSRYPKAKPTDTDKFKCRADVWLRFKEDEYQEIRRELIAKANEKRDDAVNYETTWLDVFPVSRFFFTPRMEQGWEEYLKAPDDIDKLKNQLTLKMVDWYKLPQNEGKYDNVKLCMIYLLGVE